MLLGAGLLFAPPAQAQDLPTLKAGTFWAQNWTTGGFYLLSATPAYVGEHVAIYLDDRERLSQALVNRLGQAFDDVVYPTLTAAYGSEPNPGIDGDPRIAILIYDFRDPFNDVDGSFRPADIDPQGDGNSNHKEMFYLNLEALLAEPDNAPALAAHEFAHLIIQYRDVLLNPSPDASPQASWIVEGLTTYAEHLCGYNQRADIELEAFTRNPDFSLTRYEGLRENYGASYSFISYLAQREGASFIRALVQQPSVGTTGIDATLAAQGSSDTFASLFDDWVIAGFLDSHAPQQAPYFFDGLNISIGIKAVVGTPPLLGTDNVVDSGAVYLDFPLASASTTFQAVVDGADGAPLQAALISWDSTGRTAPSVERFDLINTATGDTVTASRGYDRHTLVVWARGIPGSPESYDFTYSGTTDPPHGIQFLDMGGDDPFYQYAAALLKLGVIGGREIPPGSRLWYFQGSQNVLRAQFAKMIMIATGLHTPDIDNVGHPSFTDVPSVWDANGYPYDYVEEAANLHIVTGYSDGRFAPYQQITRAQLVLMITRAAKAVNKPLPSYTGNSAVFADVPISHPYYRAIMAAYAAGILSGSPGADGRLYFYPSAPASRNHVAKMTANLVDRLETP